LLLHFFTTGLGVPVMVIILDRLHFNFKIGQDYMGYGTAL